METPHIFGNNLSEATEPEIKSGGSRMVKVVSIVVALGLTAALLGGYLLWRKFHEEQTAAAPPPTQTKPTRSSRPVKVQVLMDEAIRKGPQALITGSVRNISNEHLSNLAVEVELTRPNGAESEVRVLGIEPKDLDPGQEGRYSVTLTGDYLSIKLLRTLAGPQGEDVGFKAARGASRPRERPPETTRTIIVNRPAAPRKGEEYINTPETPARIP